MSTQNKYSIKFAKAKNAASSGAICLGCILLSFFTVGFMIINKSANLSTLLGATGFYAGAVWFAYAFIMELLTSIESD